MPFPKLTLIAVSIIALLACGRSGDRAGTTVARVRPSILLVTLDTTRADSIGPEAANVQTPEFTALAARGRRFRQAYASVPETLPSHTTIMTGRYPAGHGVHENARYVPADKPLLADKLHQAGYRTTAFVSAFVLARRFGLARGFDLYDDQQPAGRSERSARDTADAAIAELSHPAGQPRFLWVHFYDPHYPYEPPEPFKHRYDAKPYLGEVAFMDQQLGRLVRAFEEHAPAPSAIIVVADHGEGLGDHGEAQHGNLLYQSTMHVPLIVVGPGVSAGVTDTPVSARRVFDTVLDWAGLGSGNSLRGDVNESVLGEAMKPFLEYGWQPQVMTVDGRTKAILAGRLEAYDVVADPAEVRNLGGGVSLTGRARKDLEEYPLPSPDVARAPETLDADARRRLAALGYVSATAVPVVRQDAPRPADMTRLFPIIERASGLFASAEYARAIPLLEQIRASDPRNLDAVLRLAVAHSSLHHDAKAEEFFRAAAALAPRSQDVRTYLALHYARGNDWERAVPLLEQVVAESPDRATAVESLVRLKIRQGEQAMEAGDTAAAIAAFERARALAPSAFRSHLELGVLYLDARRFDASRDALDQVSPSDAGYAMALFKRAQVSVLLREPDAPARIEAAKQHADAATRELIARERLFRK